MLQCEFCDYYKVITPSEENPEIFITVCEYAGVVFIHETKNLNIDYPCNSISYSDYLKKSESLMKKEPSFANVGWKIVNQ